MSLSLSDRTGMSIDDIISLLALCLNATYFSFRDVTYQQIHGTGMGSPVSVVIANLVMEYVEKRALDTFPRKMQFWKRYVDDICCAIPRDDISSFLLHLNGIELLENRYADFDEHNSIEKTAYVLGSELWEYDFDDLLSLVKEYVVGVWDARKHKLYGDDLCPSQLQESAAGWS